MPRSDGWKNLMPPPKKGERRNPNGRPKGSKSVVTIIKKLLDTKSKIKSEEGSSLSRAEVIAGNLIRMAEEGKLDAINSIIDRIDGKAVSTQINVESEKTYEEWLDSIDDSEV